MNPSKHALTVALNYRGKLLHFICGLAALKAHRDGISFYAGGEDIWLAEPVPTKYISVSPSH